MVIMCTSRTETEEKTVFCNDATVILVEAESGLLFSPRYGRIYFTVDHLRSNGLTKRTSLIHISPGTAARVWCNRQNFCPREIEGFSQDFEWVASEVELSSGMGQQIMEGIGTVTLVDQGHGFVDSEIFDQRLFVPGFASVNNMTDKKDACEIDKLEATRVHFVAIPNPNPRFHNQFIISIHRLTSFCQSQKSVNTPPIHWIQPSKSQEIVNCRRVPLMRISRLPTSPAPSSSPTDKGCGLSIKKPGEKLFTDCYFTYIRSSEGYLRSSKHGTISFGYASARNFNLRKVLPGDKAEVIVRPLSAEETKRDPTHKPLWRAIFINPEWKRAPEIVTGTGTMILVKKTYGMLCDNEDGKKIFVPGWAGVNNVRPGWQVPQLLKDVHYIAMPNPKSRYNEEPFAICIHPLEPDCLHNENQQASHWLHRNRFHEFPYCSKAETKIRTEQHSGEQDSYISMTADCLNSDQCITSEILKMKTGGNSNENPAHSDEMSPGNSPVPSINSCDESSTSGNHGTVDRRERNGSMSSGYDSESTASFQSHQIRTAEAPAVEDAEDFVRIAWLLGNCRDKAEARARLIEATTSMDPTQFSRLLKVALPFFKWAYFQQGARPDPV